MERKCQQKGAMEINNKSSHTADRRVATDQPHPYKKETRGRTSYLVFHSLALSANHPYCIQLTFCMYLIAPVLFSLTAKLPSMDEIRRK